MSQHSAIILIDNIFILYMFSFLLQNMGQDPMGDGLLENTNVTDFIIERMRNFQPITPVTF